jgi:hypothetical protein
VAIGDCIAHLEMLVDTTHDLGVQFQWQTHVDAYAAQERSLCSIAQISFYDDCYCAQIVSQDMLWRFARQQHTLNTGIDFLCASGQPPCCFMIVDGLEQNLQTS